LFGRDNGRLILIHNGEFLQAISKTNFAKGRRKGYD
jgi:hypothetical protein